MKVINRIKANEEFASVIKKGHCVRMITFNIFIKKNDLNRVRVGLSVGKKVGNAVIRNKVKRQLRSMIDDLVNYKNHSLDMVVIVKKEFLNKTFNENKELLYNSHSIFKELI